MIQNEAAHFQLPLHLFPEYSPGVFTIILDAVTGNLCHGKRMADDIRRRSTVKYDNACLHGKTSLPQIMIDDSTHFINLILKILPWQQRHKIIRIFPAEQTIRKHPLQLGCRIAEAAVTGINAIFTVKAPEIGNIESYRTHLRKAAIIQLLSGQFKRFLIKPGNCRKASQIIHIVRLQSNLQIHHLNKNIRLTAKHHRTKSTLSRTHVLL